MPDVLMIVAREVFRDEEYLEPKAVFERRGAHVVTASTSAGVCAGRFGATAVATMPVRAATASDYDAIVFVGGAGAADFFDDAAAHRLARDAYELDRVVAAICIAPTTLARAGLLDGRRATSFPTQETDLRAAGAEFTGDPVTVDLPFVTGDGPRSATPFAEAVADAAGLPHDPSTSGE